MGSHIVKQPNGRFARFSSVVDDFTHMNMSVRQMVDLLMEQSRDEAVEAVLRGEADAEIFNSNHQAPAADGLGRWRMDLKILASHHHPEIAKDREKTGTDPVGSGQNATDLVQPTQMILCDVVRQLRSLQSLYVSHPSPQHVEAQAATERAIKKCLEVIDIVSGR